jgi:hypothetical protein
MQRRGQCFVLISFQPSQHVRVRVSLHLSARGEEGSLEGLRHDIGQGDGCVLLAGLESEAYMSTGCAVSRYYASNVLPAAVCVEAAASSTSARSRREMIPLIPDRIQKILQGNCEGLVVAWG